MFNIVWKYGLGFRMAANSRKDACLKLMKMLGKHSLPDNVSITAA